MTGSARGPGFGLALVGVLLVAACTTSPPAKTAPARPPASQRSSAAQGRTVADVLKTIGPAAESRLRAHFASAGAPWPARRVYLIALKQEGVVEVWSEGRGGRNRVHVYSILGTSGTVGPKLREGDEQVPEGIYRIPLLNPNSAYHLSLKIDYPNRFDQEKARATGRTNLGGDIFIHGSDVSIGCLAMGDVAIEELFVLAAEVGPENVTVIIAPWDLRRRPPPAGTPQHLPWLPELYRRIQRALALFS